MSRIAWWGLALLILYVSFGFYPRWTKQGTEATLSYDASGYYWYLPSVFIYDDIKGQHFAKDILQKYQPSGTDFQQAMLTENGNYVLKYSSGLAVMFAPFFFAGHFIAGRLDYPQDGFSPPYQLSIQVGAILVALTGLWYFRKLLLIYYPDGVVAVTMVILVVGTTYLNTVVIDVGMSHGWLFTLYVFLIYSTHLFYSNYEWKYAILIGLLVGWAALTRPTDALSAVITIFWGVERINMIELKKRIALVRLHVYKLLLAVFCAFAVFSIQLGYWKYATGHWLYYSYKGQGFSFLSPHIFNYTFSYSSGWLVYTPMMYLAIVGMFIYALKGINRVSFILFSLVNFYIVCSWDVWQYGGRAMVQSYPIFMFFVAALVNHCRSRKVAGVVLSVFVVVFLYYNVWITIQYHGGGLYDVDFMNRRYFRAIVGRWHVPPKTCYLLDGTGLYTGRLKDSAVVAMPDPIIACCSTFLLDSPGAQGPEIRFSFHPTRQWLRATINVTCIEREWTGWKMPQFIIKLVDSHDWHTVRENMVRLHRGINSGETKQMRIDIPTSDISFDMVEILFWNAGSATKTRISDITIIQFNEAD